MSESRWVYEIASGRFLRGGFYLPDFDALTEGVVAFEDADPHPDPAKERFDTASPTKRRLATQAELDADTVTVKATAAQREAAADIVRATVAWTLFRILGRQPTGTEITTAMDQWRTAYRALS